MSKYSFAARELDAAFKEARNTYTAAEAAYREAEVAHSCLGQHILGESAADAAVRRARGEADFAEAKKNFETVKRTAWPAFELKRNDIMERLEAAIAQDTVVTPEQIEQNALTLLQSGICSVDDLEQLYERFDRENNAAMLKLIGKHCMELAEKKEDPQDSRDRQRLYSIGRAAAEGKNSVIRTFEQLCRTADTFGDATRWDGKPAGFVSAARWEEVTEKIIENF